MRLTLLGTGAAECVPRYGCHCYVCQRARDYPRYQRRPCSALLEAGDKRYLLDAGLMDLDRRFPVKTLDSIFLTHFHPDHVQGLFHLRWGIGDQISVYCPPDQDGCADLYKNPGILALRTMQPFVKEDIGTFCVTPLPLIHSKLTFGYLFESGQKRVAYLTDTKGLSQEVLKILHAGSIDLVVLDACTSPNLPHTNHNSIDEALTLVEMIKPGKTILTHIGHELDSWLLAQNEPLPDHVQIGRDGLVIEMNESGDGG
ncbi:MAG: phosphonate metabolism protein PhnP [Desulfuromonadales bacterium]|nr:phosphonate metabolism protein PhnP [Desulfuromonadales bacterium]